MSEIEIRQIYIKRLRQDLIGPKDGDNEIIVQESSKDDTPIERYKSGILWPIDSKNMDHEEVDDVQTGIGENENSTHQNGVSGFHQFKPSSAGISFHYEHSDKEDPKVEVSLRFAIYNPKNIFDDEKEKVIWERSPFYIKEVINLKEPSQSILIPFDQANESLKIEIFVRSFELALSDQRGVQKKAVTLRVSNKMQRRSFNSRLEEFKLNESNQNQDEIEEEPNQDYMTSKTLGSIFQFEMEVKYMGEGRFSNRPIKVNADDEDKKLSELIYRDNKEFATGHVCSASWDQDSIQPDKVFTDWMPAYEVAPTSADGSEIITNKIKEKINKPSIEAKFLSDSSKNEVLDALNSLHEGYEEWINNEKKKVTYLEPSFIEQAEINLKDCEKASKRIKEGIDLLSSDIDSLNAFKWANEAMQKQFLWSKNREDKNSNIEINENQKILKWRPFQLAFSLMTLSSVSDRNHEDREVLDLLWFPTGGGKTEAYFLIIAYLLFFRRLKSLPEGDIKKVDVIMRYTLRALTDQQFQRATSMILACNKIRSDNIELFGKEPFSIGMWVGKASTPNNFQDALNAINNSGAEDDPRKIKTCPCCGDSLDFESSPQRKGIIPKCINDECEIKGELPILTIDSQIYIEPPSLLLGTVDKFVRLVYEKKTKSLFNESYPPELIIQDELHLIDGPLGSMVGLLEIAIDELCLDKQQKKVKYLGSTATIRKAKTQVRRVFDRSSFQFPPPAIDASDSGFSVPDNSKPGRLYIGLTTSGSSDKTIREIMSASLLQTVMDKNIPIEKKDLYSTLVSYFGSLRILGAAYVGLQEATDQWIDALAKQRNENPRNDREIPRELTSRTPSNELTELLTETLLESFGERRHIEIILATNMISVGVDIPRLSLMSVNGQPKSMTEYIQATSRVGRDKPGLVFTLYNHHKIRDKSYYESFQTWHSSLYRSVEATTVTPFAPRAMDRSLHLPFFIIYRHRVFNQEKGEAIYSYDLINEYKATCTNILDRVKRCASIESYEEAQFLFSDLLSRWEELSQEKDEHGKRKLKYFHNTFAPFQSLLVSAEDLAERMALGKRTYPGIKTTNSVRNVDASSHFQLKEGAINQNKRRKRKNIFQT